MSTSAYSDLKAGWHLDRINTIRTGEQVVPVHVQLIISDLCNQDCHFCSYRMTGGFSTELFAQDGEKNPVRMIPSAKAIEIINDCSIIGVKALQFTGGGEPTVHPNHLEIFRAAQSNGMRTALVTNGVILRDGWKDVYPAMDWIRVSIDSGTAETYAKVRNSSLLTFDKVWHHVGELAAEFRAAGSDCLLGVGYVVTMENWAELHLACERAKDLGVPYVRVSALFSGDRTSHYGENISRIRDEAESVKAKYDGNGFSVVNMFNDRIHDLEQHAPDYEFCGYQQFNMYIGADLNVYRCCTTSYTNHGKVGSLKERRLSEWFYSKEKKDAYGNFDARTCHTCQFNGKNRVINYLVNEHPIHVEFV